MKQHIGLGTAAIGRPQYINIRGQEEGAFDLELFKKKGKAVLETAYQRGIRYFDTAPGYGLAEKLLLDWVLEKKDRSIELATKWGYTYLANFDKNAAIHEVKDHSLSKLIEQWSVSQDLLPYLTTYQIHSATIDTGVLDNKAVLDRLAGLKSDHNLTIGLTSTGANQSEIIRKAMTIEAEGNPLFGAYQVTYNIFDQSLFEVIKELKSSGAKIIIKEALANGRVFPNSKFPYYRTAYLNLKALANKYETGIDAIALRFCIDTLSPFVVLSGASSTQQVIENLSANDFELNEEEIDTLSGLRINPGAYWTERKQLNWN